MTDRATFTIRLDPALVEALDHERAGKRHSRNWMIEQAVRAWLDGGQREREAHAAADISAASGVSFEAALKAVQDPVQMEAPQATQTPPVDGAGVDQRTSQNTARHPAGPHRHRFTAEVPGKRRGIQGVIYATYQCDDPDCGRTLERKAPK